MARKTKSVPLGELRDRLTKELLSAIGSASVRVLRKEYPGRMLVIVNPYRSYTNRKGYLRGAWDECWPWRGSCTPEGYGPGVQLSPWSGGYKFTVGATVASLVLAEALGIAESCGHVRSSFPRALTWAFFPGRFAGPGSLPGTVEGAAVHRPTN